MIRRDWWSQKASEVASQEPPSNAVGGEYIGIGGGRLSAGAPMVNAYVLQHYSTAVVLLLRLAITITIFGIFGWIQIATTAMRKQGMPRRVPYVDMNMHMNMHMNAQGNIH
jgi:hypothetical protein